MRVIGWIGAAVMFAASIGMFAHNVALGFRTGESSTHRHGLPRTLRPLHSYCYWINYAPNPSLFYLQQPRHTPTRLPLLLD